MAEFEEKLSSILENPQAMGQIMQLAQSLGGTDEEKNTQPQMQTNDGGESPFAFLEGMGDISSLLGNIDPAMIQEGMRLLGAVNQGEDSSANLLYALRPYIKEEKRHKIEKAVKIARLSRILRIAFRTFGEKKGQEDANV